MIQISHYIQIFSNTEAFIDFYYNYEKTFAQLAPRDHIRFKFLGAPPIQIGTTTESVEIMLGKCQKVKHRIVEFTPERIVLKGLFPLSLIGGKLTFKIEKYNGYIILFEIIEFGFKSSIGRLYDSILRIYLKDKYSFLNNHSKETLSNIKKIIEGKNSSFQISSAFLNEVLSNQL
jgi:hypothetical protein